MKPLVRRAIFALQTFAVASWLGACGEQGEGERCDPRNGKTADCAAGLVCTTGVLGVGTVSRNVGICCPPEGEPTDEQACFPSEFTFDAGMGGAPGDAAADADGALPEASVDAGGTDGGPVVTDGGQDASVGDATPDARPDAP